MAVHHHSTVALCPFPLGPILRPLQFCFVFLTLVSVVVSSVPTATGAKAMATRHAMVSLAGHPEDIWTREKATQNTKINAQALGFDLARP